MSSASGSEPTPGGCGCDCLPTSYTLTISGYSDAGQTVRLSVPGLTAKEAAADPRLQQAARQFQEERGVVVAWEDGEGSCHRQAASGALVWVDHSP